MTLQECGAVLEKKSFINVYSQISVFMLKSRLVMQAQLHLYSNTLPSIQNTKEVDMCE